MSNTAVSENHTAVDSNTRADMGDFATLSISYRGHKIDVPLENHTTVSLIKDAVALQVDASVKPAEIKLLWKGKVLQDDNENLFELLTNRKRARTYKLVAMGVSASQVEQLETELEQGMKRSVIDVRDDLTKSGRQQMSDRARLGRQMMQKSAARNNTNLDKKYGFGKIETLPNLPNEAEARKLLETLASDPGVLACMAKHQWNVGSLAELYPDGKVGESPVCVMGLNRNKGQQILLRLRTDDLKGFRKNTEHPKSLVPRTFP